MRWGQMERVGSFSQGRNARKRIMNGQGLVVLDNEEAAPRWPRGAAGAQPAHPPAPVPLAHCARGRREMRESCG